jgi:hypothetical protein
VIVASSIQSDGSLISGDIKKIVIVRTNPGYGPSPGHPGTGQVVAIFCAFPNQSVTLLYQLLNFDQLSYFLPGLGQLSSVEFGVRGYRGLQHDEICLL